MPPSEDNIRSDSPSARTDRRHSSSASTTTGVTGDSVNTTGSGGRRSRPSVISASSQLPTVREQNQMRAMSMNSTNKDRPSSLAKLVSDESVVSSKKVGSFSMGSLKLWLTFGVAGLDKLQQSCGSQCRERRSQAATAQSIPGREPRPTRSLQEVEKMG